MKKKIIIMTILMAIVLSTSVFAAVYAEDGYVSGTLERNRCVNSVLTSTGGGTSYTTFNKCHGGNLVRTIVDIRGYMVPVLNPSASGYYEYFTGYNEYTSGYRASANIGRANDNVIVDHTQHHTYLRCTKETCYAVVECPNSWH